MIKDIKKYERYAELKNLVAEAEIEIKEINKEILDELRELGVEEFPTDFGKFVLSKRKKWIYPEEVIRLEEEYKAKKKESEQIGTADYLEAVELRFNKIKDK